MTRYDFSANLGPVANETSQKSESSPNTMSGSQPSSKPVQNSSHSPANDPGNSVSINQSGGPPPSKGNFLKEIENFNFKYHFKITWKTSTGIGNQSIRGGRGGGGITQRRGNSNAGNYNPNINVTGNDIQQGKILLID